MPQAVCLHINGFGQYCEKPMGHTGNHRCRTFSHGDAQQAWIRQRYIGDPRWTWTEHGWQTTDPALVDEAMSQLAESKTSGQTDETTGPIYGLDKHTSACAAESSLGDVIDYYK